jgi:hypothetical protein
LEAKTRPLLVGTGVGVAVGVHVAGGVGEDVRVGVAVTVPVADAVADGVPAAATVFVGVRLGAAVALSVAVGVVVGAGASVSLPIAGGTELASGRVSAVLSMLAVSCVGREEVVGKAVGVGRALAFRVARLRAATSVACTSDAVSARPHATSTTHNINHRKALTGLWRIARTSSL